LPRYDHNNLAFTFVPLEEKIQELLKTVIPTGAVQIPLKKESESKFTGQIVDDQLVTNAQVILAASAEMSEGQLIMEQAAAPSTAESLLGLALPALSWCTGRCLLRRCASNWASILQVGKPEHRKCNSGTRSANHGTLPFVFPTRSALQG
jgi:hypothetical protein